MTRRSSPRADDFTVLELTDLTPEDDALADEALDLLVQHELDDRAAGVPS